MKLILVVDDDESLLHMSTRLLETLGYRGVSAPDTATALRLLRSDAVDAVLLDVVLGAENGWEALRLIREAGPVPVVMMSGATMDEDVSKDAAALEAQGVLQKPFTSGDLADCLKALFSAPPPVRP